MRVDIMVDIETLGKGSDSTIIQISAIAFDIKTGKAIEEFDMIADPRKNSYNKVDMDTILWWINTDADLFKELLGSGSYSSDYVLQEFHDWIKDLVDEHGRENVYLWGNGILFDNKMIQHQMGEAGLIYPIYYRNDRDVRTLLELTSSKIGRSEKEIKQYIDTLMPNVRKHNALDDVKWQIELAKYCYKQLLS